MIKFKKKAKQKVFLFAENGSSSGCCPENGGAQGCCPGNGSTSGCCPKS